MKPVWQNFAEKHPEITFLVIDLDDNPELADTYGVKAIPMFISFNASTKIEEIVGAQGPKSVSYTHLTLPTIA